MFHRDPPDTLPAPLDPVATRELFRQARLGDGRSRRRLIEHNLRLVRAVLRRFLEARSFTPVDGEDLFQAGCVGLLQAVDGFDPERGIRFSTYAVPFILGEMRRHLRQQAAPDLPRSLWQRSGRVAAARTQLLQQFGREPTLAELGQATGLSAQDVAAALEAQMMLTGSSSPPAARHRRAAGGQERGDARERMSEPGEEDVSFQRADERVALQEMLARLAPADRQLLELRFFQQLSQVEVAARLGLSQPYVSRRERQLLAQLRSGFRE